MADWDVTTANARLEFDTDQGLFNSCCAIDANHFINFWSGSGFDGYVQVFTINTTTWAVTTANANLEFDTQSGQHNSCFNIDANHFINFFTGGASNKGSVQVFTVNTTTWAVTTANAKLEFDADAAYSKSCYSVDSNHFIAFWSSYFNSYVNTQIFTVNTTTWAVTTANASLRFDTVWGEHTSCYAIDANHFINFWFGSGDDGIVQVFTVNTSTWAVTTAATSLKFDTTNGKYDSCYQIDSNHFINFWSGIADDGYVQVFTVNTSTWAVTTAATSLEFDATNGQYNSCYKIDSNHFINFWSGEGTDGYMQVFAVNTSTWAVTTAATSLEFDTAAGTYNSCYKIDSNHFINFWSGEAGDGYVQVFTVALPAGAAAVRIPRGPAMYYQNPAVCS